MAFLCCSTYSSHWGKISIHLYTSMLGVSFFGGFFNSNLKLLHQRATNRKLHML